MKVVENWAIIEPDSPKKDFRRPVARALFSGKFLIFVETAHVSSHEEPCSIIKKKTHKKLSLSVSLQDDIPIVPVVPTVFGE